MNALTSTRDFSPALAGEIMETVLIKGDLHYLNSAQRLEYCAAICQSIGLNPLTKPFAYIELNGKLTLYALKACTDQLRQIKGVSIKIVSHKVDGDLYTVHVRAKDATGREDEDFGVVVLPPENRALDRANAILKAVTKAKRRVTLSICGLGFLDETEVEDIPAEAKREAQSNPDQEVAHHLNPLPENEKPEIQVELPTTPAAPIKKPRRRSASADRQIDPRYEAVIKADAPRRAFDRPSDPDPDTERAILEAEELAEEFIRLEHEIGTCPTVMALERWYSNNHERIAKFSEGEQKNALRKAYANKKAELQPHSLSQKAMAARGPRYVRPELPLDDGLGIPDYLRRQPQNQAAE